MSAAPLRRLAGLGISVAQRLLPTAVATASAIDSPVTSGHFGPVSRVGGETTEETR